jgi:hypothetical protein
MNDDPTDDPDDERSERDRELYAAVLFRIKQNLERNWRWTEASSTPRRPTRAPKKIQTSPLPARAGPRKSPSGGPTQRTATARRPFLLRDWNRRVGAAFEIHRGPFFAPHEGRHFSTAPLGAVFFRARRSSFDDNRD